MIIESILVVAFAFGLDFAFGDPKNKYHPTAWVGIIISKLTPFAKNPSATTEKIFGIFLVLAVTLVVGGLLVLLDVGISIISVDYVSLIASVIAGAILLKTTIAIRGMERHAMVVVASVESANIVAARDNLAMIVKRNTKNLDKNHVLSGVLESISENTVDGITGPLFYYALFGLAGAFIHRTINTIDAMIGYKNTLFSNIGWFGANCDNVLNFVPARITALIMVLTAKIVGADWKNSYFIMIRDARKTESTNAGYPMAALAGALGTKFEKIDHYTIGDGTFDITKEHVKSAITIMKVSSVLFFGIVVVPIVMALSYVGWWFHA